MEETCIIFEVHPSAMLTYGTINEVKGNEQGKRFKNYQTEKS